VAHANAAVAEDYSPAGLPVTDAGAHGPICSTAATSGGTLHSTAHPIQEVWPGVPAAGVQFHGPSDPLLFLIRT
jgi:hypothetical protein